MSELWWNKEKLLTKNINAFVGYARKQAAKYGIKGSRMDALKRTIECLDKMPANERLDLPEHTLALVKLIEQNSELVSLEKTPLISMEHIGQVDGKTLPHLQCCGRKISLTSRVHHAKSIFKRIFDEYGSRAVKAHLDGGKDWKALSHAVRVNSQALELMNTGVVTFPRPDRELLLKIKTGSMPYEEVATLIEEGLAKLEETSKTCSLREKPDREWADDFLARVHYDIVIKEGL